MLTKVILDGKLGRKFGNKWELAVSSPAEALRMIEANKPGVFAWIRDNLALYDRYKIICKYDDGRTEYLDENDFPMERKVSEIHFVPVPQGAGGVFKAVVGIVLIAVDYMTGYASGGYLTAMGAGMVLGGVVQMLTPVPKRQTSSQQDAGNFTSSYFNGPTNTAEQGAPVSLIYGRVLVGSQAVSAALTIDKLR